MSTEQLMTAVPLPRTDGFGWGVVCPVHRDLHPDTEFMDAHREDAEAYACVVRCGERSHETGEYPTGDPSGMSFICNRWVFTGPEGYRVRFDTVGERTGYFVFRYTGSHNRLTDPRPRTWTDAHRYAFTLARPRR